MKRMSRRLRSRAAASRASPSSSSWTVVSRVRSDVGMASLLFLAVGRQRQQMRWGSGAAAGVPLIVHRLQCTAQDKEAVEVMCRKEVVDIGQCCTHAGGDRAVVLLAQQRIEPDKSMAVAPQPRHFVGQDAHVAAVPTIADDQHHRPLAQYPARPAIIECAQRLTNARATRPVFDNATHVTQRVVYIPSCELARNTRQACAEDKGLNVLQAVGNGMDEVQEQAGVDTHLAADVAEDDQWPRVPAACGPGGGPRAPAGGRTTAGGAAQRTAYATSGRSPPPCLPFAKPPAGALHQRACLLQLVPGKILKVLAAQHLIPAIGAEAIALIQVFITLRAACLCQACRRMPVVLADGCADAPPLALLRLLTPVSGQCQRALTLRWDIEWWQRWVVAAGSPAPEIGEGHVEGRLILVPGDETYFEEDVERLAICDVDQR